MSTTTVISNVCQVVEDFGRSIGLAEFEIERVVHSRAAGKDEWIVSLHFTKLDSAIIEDDQHCAIVVVDSETEQPRLVEGL